MYQITKTGQISGIKIGILSAADPPVGILKNLTRSVSVPIDIKKNHRLLESNFFKHQAVFKSIMVVVQDLCD
jgi:hypothetical protein